MDDRRFDALVKAVAAGTSRRTMLKGLLGLGGVAVAGGALRQDVAEAARRPTPTPKPIVCRPPKYPLGGVCRCPAGAPYACGPDCCTEATVQSPQPGHTECCDNACCHGTCYGEELCCPTNNRGSTGQLPPSHQICDWSGGTTCCEADQACCDDGCCTTFCWLPNGGASECCPAEQVCPGVTSDGDVCCGAGETCCGAGTAGNVCVNLANDECCTTADCSAGGTLCRNCTEGHVCSTTACSEGSVCCPTVDGPNACQPGACCPDGRGCDGGEECCGSGADAFCSDDCDCAICDEQELACCYIDQVFAGCWAQGTEGACCTAESCTALNDFGNCLVGACIDFECEQRSSCAQGESCCQGDCIPDSDCCEATEGPCPADCDPPCGQCTACDGFGMCAAANEGGACSTGFCQDGVCTCLPTSALPPGAQVLCSTSSECCSGCCADSSATAAEICATVAPEAVGLCIAFVEAFLTDDICTGLSFIIPVLEVEVFVPCIGLG